MFCPILTQVNFSRRYTRWEHKDNALEGKWEVPEQKPFLLLLPGDINDDVPHTHLTSPQQLSSLRTACGLSNSLRFPPSSMHSVHSIHWQKDKAKFCRSGGGFQGHLGPTDSCYKLLLPILCLLPNFPLFPPFPNKRKSPEHQWIWSSSIDGLPNTGEGRPADYRRKVIPREARPAKPRRP